MGALDGVVLFVPSARAHLDIGDSQMIAEVFCVRADISGLATTGVCARHALLHDRRGVHRNGTAVSGQQSAPSMEFAINQDIAGC